MNQEQRTEVREEAVTPSRKGFAITSLVTGIVGAVFGLLGVRIAYVLGIVAIVFGAISLAKKRKRKMSGTGLALGIAAIVLAFVMQFVILFTALDFLFDVDIDGFGIDSIKEESTEEILDEYLSVKARGYIVGNDFLEVTVTNKSDERHSFEIVLEILDANGVRLATDTVYVDRLGGGSSEIVNAFSEKKLMDHNLSGATLNVISVTMD